MRQLTVLVRMSDLSKLRLLVWQRVRARFTSRRRSLGMQIHHEKRRLVKAGVSLDAVLKFVEEVDTRPRCQRCGNRLG